jgi:hypothetical protein
MESVMFGTSAYFNFRNGVRKKKRCPKYSERIYRALQPAILDYVLLQLWTREGMSDAMEVE